jgi:hypothetical protein
MFGKYITTATLRGNPFFALLIWSGNLFFIGTYTDSFLIAILAAAFIDDYNTFAA